MNFNYLSNKLREKNGASSKKEKEKIEKNESRGKKRKKRQTERGKERERDEDDLKVRKKEIRNCVLVDFKFNLNFLLFSSSTAPDTLLSFVQGVHLYIL